VVSGGYEDFVPGAGASAQRILKTIGNVPSGWDGPYRMLREWTPLSIANPTWRQVSLSHPLVEHIYVLECGAGGDCLFHALAGGLNQLHEAPIFSMQQMRELAAAQLTPEVFGGSDGFFQNWDPPDHYGRLARRRLLKMSSDAERVVAMRGIISRVGHGYWGETETLRHLLLFAPPFRDRRIGFAVVGLQDPPPGQKVGPKPFTQILRLQDTEHLMCLYHVRHGGRDEHWMLLGVTPTDGSPTIASTFPINSYPPPLLPFLRG
jgi:hypothetical protein